MNTIHASDKQTAILDAAQKRFAHFGLTKVTMDEIAADLGISKAALYYYFETKEEIFRRVIAREQLEFIQRIELIIGKAVAASEKLLEYFQQHLTLLDKLLNLRIISLHANDTIHPIMHELFRNFSGKEIAFLEAILAEGRKNGEFAIESPEKAAMLLQHILQGLRLRFFKTMKLRDIDESEVKTLANEIKLFSKIFIQGISQ